MLCPGFESTIDVKAARQWCKVDSLACGGGCLLARGALLLARGSGGVLCLGPGDQVTGSNKVTETHNCCLLRFVEWVAKPSQHSWAASVGGLLRGGKEAEGCPEAASGSRLAA